MTPTARGIAGLKTLVSGSFFTLGAAVAFGLAFMVVYSLLIATPIKYNRKANELATATTRIYALENSERPYFSAKSSRLILSQNTENAFGVEFQFLNIGKRAAINTSARHVSIMQDFSGSPVDKTVTIANETGPDGTLNIQKHFYKPIESLKIAEMKSFYMWVVINYEDAINHAVFRQSWVLKWNDATTGIPTRELHHTSVEEREKLQQVLQSRGIQWIE